MNRNARRAARGIARSKSVNRVVAVHEAGHAVGRFLTASALGYSPEEAIVHIDIYVAPLATGNLSLDGQSGIHLDATTCSPMFSRELYAFVIAEAPSEVAKAQEVVRILAQARAIGMDVDGWVRAKAIGTVLGPMAEAKLLGKPFASIWNYSSEEDLKCIVQDGLLANLSQDQITHVINEAMSIAEREINRPEVWRAILALANKLKSGRMPGRTAAAIIAGALTDRKAMSLSGPPRGGSRVSRASALLDFFDRSFSSPHLTRMPAAAS